MPHISRIMRLRVGGVHSIRTPSKDTRKRSADSNTEVTGMTWMPAVRRFKLPSCSPYQYLLSYLLSP